MSVSQLQEFLKIIFSYIPINLVDVVFLFIFTIYVIEDASFGLISSFSHLVSTITGFIIGLLLYSHISKLLVSYGSLTKGFSDALAFLTVSVVFFILTRLLLHRFIEGYRPKIPVTIDYVGGGISGIISFFIMASFVVSLLLAFPVPEVVKSSVQKSFIGNSLLIRSSIIERNVRSVFGGAINDVINFLTVEPGTNETVRLHFTVQDPQSDKLSEEKMFNLINNEREKYAVPKVLFSEELSVVARAHAKDMFIRGYFSHYTLEGLSPFDRLERFSISYNHAAENIALTPNVDLAMDGFMKSLGHKENIISKDFTKVGVGVMDGGIFGKMFVQEFTD